MKTMSEVLALTHGCKISNQLSYDAMPKRVKIAE